MSHTSVLEAAEQSLHIPRSLFARWLVETGRLTDALPVGEVLPVIPRLETPATRRPLFGLWKYSRE